MRATADVVVIGGGVMGCSILFNLARMGITNTVLLEKDILNGGSTGRSQSICRMHYSNPVTATMAWESLKRLHPLRGSGRRAVRVHRDRIPGGGERRRPARAGAQHAPCRYGLGIDTMVVTAADLRDLAPMVSVSEDEAMGWEPQSGYADPYLVTSSYANAARDLGAEINLGLPSTGIEVDGGRVRAV